MARWDSAWFNRLFGIIAELPFREPLERTAIRRELGKDPIAFAVLYFGRHIKNAEGKITWSEAHFEWARMAEGWKESNPPPRSNRTAIIAPRECGKSTWWFLILPMWAAANGHAKFIAAFADAGTQAEKHLASFRSELDNNPFLGLDYPTLCEPLRRRKAGTTVADRAGMILQANGFVFAARGIDSAVLGMKVGALRPDVIILDDVEPDEANYSPDQAEKRLGTVTDSIFPLNIRARVVFVGTVTMPGSIMHQLVKAAQGVETANWISDENVQPHHFHAIVHDAEGTERSLWPAKWPLEFLNSIRHTRSYAKNYENDPMARDGVYWTRDDFHYDTFACTRTLLVIDPAVTSKQKSDYTGLAVIGYAPGSPERNNPETGRPPRVLIKMAIGVKLSPEELRQYVVLKVLPKFPEIRMILVETNQGGDLWRQVFHDLPGIVVNQTKATAPKEVRFAEALEPWQRHQVFCAERFPMLEEQAVGFPRAAYDDVIDAGTTGVRYFIRPVRKVKAGSMTTSYLGGSRL